MSTTTATSWTGWHRPDGRSPWRAIVEGADEATVFHRLLDAIAVGDKAVVPQGLDPNRKPATRRRRRF